MKKHFYDFAYEICDISEKNNGVFSDACSTFLSNIRDVGRADDQYTYAGGEGVDYAALKHYHDELEKESDSMTPYPFELTKALHDAYKSKDKEKCVALLKEHFEKCSPADEAGDVAGSAE